MSRPAPPGPGTAGPARGRYGGVTSFLRWSALPVTSLSLICFGAPGCGLCDPGQAPRSGDTVLRHAAARARARGLRTVGLLLGVYVSDELQHTLLRAPLAHAGRTDTLPPRRARGPRRRGDVIAAPDGRWRGTCKLSGSSYGTRPSALRSLTQPGRGPDGHAPSPPGSRPALVGDVISAPDGRRRGTCKLRKRPNVFVAVEIASRTSPIVDKQITMGMRLPPLRGAREWLQGLNAPVHAEASAQRPTETSCADPRALPGGAVARRCGFIPAGPECAAEYLSQFGLI